jgi:hypothetical protein
MSLLRILREPEVFFSMYDKLIGWIKLHFNGRCSFS